MHEDLWCEGRHCNVGLAKLGRNMSEIIFDDEAGTKG
jgi:hypothetical protein